MLIKEMLTETTLESSGCESLLQVTLKSVAQKMLRQ